MGSEVLEQFRLALQGKMPESVKEEREKLIGEGKTIAKKLKEYRTEPPDVSYLTASTIQITTHGLEANRYNLNLDRVPLSKIEEAVEKGKEKLTELDKKTDELLQKFSTDVAEICFTENTSDKGFIIQKLYGKKQEDLKSICQEKMLLHPSFIRIDIDAKDFLITKGRYDSELHFRPHRDTFDFLSDYDVIKASLIESLNYTFREDKK